MAAQTRPSAAIEETGNLAGNLAQGISMQNYGNTSLQNCLRYSKLIESSRKDQAS